MKKQSIGFSLVAAGLILASNAAFSADGYVTDTRGVAVRSSSGSCWRTGYWTPSMATPECDAELAPAPKVEKAVAAPTPAPVKAEAKTLTLGADGLFAFGKATLLPKGKTQLNDVVAKVKGHSFEQIVVEGHTDRLGAPKLNQSLSQKRAEAVKAYLVSKKIDGRLIQATGKGSSEPVTQADQCPGKGGAKVKACLAQDRRVTIKVVGLK